MNTADRIAAVALLVALGVFLNFSMSGRMDTMNLALEAYDDRVDALTVGNNDRFSRTEAALSRLESLLLEVPDAVRDAPGYNERVRATEAALRDVLNQIERLESAVEGINRRLVTIERQ